MADGDTQGSPKNGVALLLQLTLSEMLVNSLLGISFESNKGKEKEQRSLPSPTHIHFCCHVFRRPRQGPHFGIQKQFWIDDS